MFDFLKSKPTAENWEFFVKNATIAILVLILLVQNVLALMYYDTIYTGFYVGVFISSFLVWATFIFRKNSIGKILSLFSAFYFGYNHAGDIIDIMNYPDIFGFILFASELLTMVVMFKVCTFLLNDFGQQVDNDIDMSFNSANDSKYQSLSKLKELLDSGAITQEEFEAEKAKLLK